MLTEAICLNVVMWELLSEAGEWVCRGLVACVRVVSLRVMSCILEGNLVQHCVYHQVHSFEV